MSYNPFQSLSIVPSYYLGHTLQWAIDPTFTDKEPHNFTIQIADTFNFDELLTEISVGNKFFGVDNTKIKQANINVVYYRVKLETKDNTYYSSIVTSETSNVTRRQYVIAMEIARKEYLRLKKLTGSNAWLLKRKIYGTAVKDNSVDPISGLALTNDSSDYGTAITHGYYDKIGFYYSLENQEFTRRMDPGGAGVLELTNISVRTLGFPVIAVGDIIVEPNQDHRWYVKDRQETPFPGTTLSLVQTLELSLIQNTDPLYSIITPQFNNG